MATLQIRIDDTLKAEADALFNSLGLDTSTAVRVFLNASIESGGLPFAVRHRELPASLAEAVSDTVHRRNLIGPFDTAEEAVAAMLKE